MRGLTPMAFPTAIETGADATTTSPGLLLGARILFLLLTVLGLWFTYVGWIAPEDNEAVDNFSTARS